MAPLGPADLTASSKGAGETRMFVDGSSEETLAAFTSQGVEMVARGSVTTYHTVPWFIFPTEHDHLRNPLLSTAASTCRPQQGREMPLPELPRLLCFPFDLSSSQQLELGIVAFGT